MTADEIVFVIIYGQFALIAAFFILINFLDGRRKKNSKATSSTGNAS